MILAHARFEHSLIGAARYFDQHAFPVPQLKLISSSFDDISDVVEVTNIGCKTENAAPLEILKNILP